VLAAVFEVRVAAEQHVSDSRRCPEFAGVCALLDAYSKVDGDPGYVSVVVDFDLTGVDAVPNCDFAWTWRQRESTSRVGCL